MREVAEFSRKPVKSPSVVVAITSVYLHDSTQVISQTSAALLSCKM